MNTDTKKTKIKSRSIAKRLNASLKRRNLVRSLIADILVASLFIVGWCLTVEGATGGRVANVTDRRFATESDFDFSENIRRTIDDVKTIFSGGKGDVHTPFHGVFYCYTVNPGEENAIAAVTPVAGSTEYSSDASLALTAIVIVTAFVIVVQLLAAIFGSLLGGRMIKRYLSPIDEIALMAEEISAKTERHTTDQARAREVFHDDGEVTADELEFLTDAIDEIDDSCSRIAVHRSELSGIEAAVNNMLRRLEEGKRKQIRFVDDASHELRTPIAIIQGYVNMLDRWGKDDPKIRDEAIAAIKNEADHMKTLIDQLLFLARGEMSRHVMENKPVDCAMLMWELFEESRMLDSGHEYVISAPDSEENEAGESVSPLMVVGDSAMLKQCMRILRDNAVKYTPAGGQITLRGYLKNEKVCLEVTDTGIGIPQNELSRIFDRFYRGSNARTDNTSGSGLGLSIAKWIVEEHGGEIEALSSADIGTRMTVIIGEKKHS
ncbi:MAG: hypothetical protein IKV39_00925 [Clostridia bacterium]|nr:hypothetical protein [Clostridia bacterium]